MKQKIYSLIICLLIITMCDDSYSQKINIPIIVNNLVGDTLSLEERNYYNLLPTINGFQFAVFYLNPDSSLNADVKYLAEGHSKDTLIQNYRSLKSLNYHIYARNALVDGTPENTLNNTVQVHNEGAEVYAYLHDSRETSGELLSVRKNSLLILKTDCDDDLKNQDCISKVNTSEINKLIIKGNSNVAEGIVLGLVAAIAVGAIIYQSYYENSSSWLRGLAAYEKSKVPIILSSIGCITLGVTIGIYTSTPDEEIKTFSKYEISGLSAYSRYQSNEPNELKKIK